MSTVTAMTVWLRRGHIAQIPVVTATWQFHLSFWRYGVGMLVGVVMGGLGVLFLSDQYGVLRQDSAAGLAAGSLFSLLTIGLTGIALWRMAKSSSSNARGSGIAIIAALTLGAVVKFVLPFGQTWGSTHPRLVAALALLLIYVVLLASLLAFVRLMERDRWPLAPATTFPQTNEVEYHVPVPAAARPVPSPRTPATENDFGIFEGLGER